MASIGHIGAWGTPDLGISEAIGSFFGSGRTSQGGSDIIPNSSSSGGQVLGENTTQSYSTGAYPASGPTSQYASNPTNYTAPTSSPTTTSGGASSGGGGGSTSRFNPADIYDPSTGKTKQSAFQEGLIDQYGNVMARPDAPDMGQMDSIFNESNNYLNQAQNNLNSDKALTIQDILAQFNQGQNIAGQGRQAALGTIAGNQQGINTRKDDSMGANRRLYQELGLGGQQRFGGASSAGQAYSEITGREQMRQQGQIQRDFVQATQQIEGQKVQVEKDFSTAVQNLDMQKNLAINETTRDFQNKMLEITRMRGANESARQQAKLGALQDYKNQIFQIQLQNSQFQQSIYAQKQASDLQLSQYQKELGMQSSASGGTANSFADQATTNPNSALSMGGANYTSASGQAQQVDQTGRVVRKDDQLIGAVNPVSSRSIFDELRMN